MIFFMNSEGQRAQTHVCQVTFRQLQTVSRASSATFQCSYALSGCLGVVILPSRVSLSKKYRILSKFAKFSIFWSSKIYFYEKFYESEILKTGGIFFYEFFYEIIHKKTG